MMSGKLKSGLLACSIALASFIAQAAVLEVSIDPSQKYIDRFKPGDDINLIVKNNAPVTHTLTLKKADGATLSGCDQPIAPGSSCNLVASVSEFGYVSVRVGAADGLYETYAGPFVSALRVATFNLSFDRGDFEKLKKQMAYGRTQQQQMIDKWKADELSGDEKTEAENVIQIRNIAEIIQRTRPDLLVMAEFDNNGTTTDSDANNALQGFQANYLTPAQKDDLQGISFPNVKNVPTNTGLLSPFDLDNRGDPNKPALPSDAWGFGFYHGQYAFAVASKFPFGTMRTFQEFKWVDMPAEGNPEIDICDNPEDKPIPATRQCGDPWYSADAWAQFRVSSKNHIDLVVKVPAEGNTEKDIHFLVSHPTPPIFDGSARRNYKRNRAEIKFWHDYVGKESYFKDDGGVKGGLAEDAYFVIAGDLNADPYEGDGHRPTILGLLESSSVNTAATTGALIPVSKGAQEYLSSPNCERTCDRNNGDTITSISGLRLDHVIPSANFNVLRSGVFWPASGEPGRNLVDDPKLGQGKGVSSDHRLVWVDLYIPSKP